MIVKINICQESAASNCRQAFKTVIVYTNDGVKAEFEKFQRKLPCSCPRSRIRLMPELWPRTLLLSSLYGILCYRGSGRSAAIIDIYNLGGKQCTCTHARLSSPYLHPANAIIGKRVGSPSGRRALLLSSDNNKLGGTRQG